jgi:hypothetical protein
MAYEPKPGSFSLFKNDRKEKDTHPDYKGDGLALDGTPIWVSAWIKKGAKGSFMSCSIQAKEAKPKTELTQSYQADDLPDDLPF